MTVYSLFPSDLMLKQSLLAESYNTMKADKIKKMGFYDLHTFLNSKQCYCTVAISRALTSYANIFFFFFFKLYCFMALLHQITEDWGSQDAVMVDIKLLQ